MAITRIHLQDVFMQNLHPARNRTLFIDNQNSKYRTRYVQKISQMDEAAIQFVSLSYAWCDLGPLAMPWHLEPVSFDYLLNRWWWHAPASALISCRLWACPYKHGDGWATTAKNLISPSLLNPDRYTLEIEIRIVKAEIWQIPCLH